MKETTQQKGKSLKEMIEAIYHLEVESDQNEREMKRLGLFTPSTIGRFIMGRPREFCEWLRRKGILYHYGRFKQLTPPQIYIDMGYFFVDHGYHEENKIHYQQTYFTPKGARWISAYYQRSEKVLDEIDIEILLSKSNTGERI